MGYKKDILAAEEIVSDLKERFAKMKEVIKTLKVGDTVYEQGTHGGWDLEYYPQEILEIDLEEAKIFVHEKSINSKKWVTSFHLLQNDEFIFYY